MVEGKKLEIEIGVGMVLGKDKVVVFGHSIKIIKVLPRSHGRQNNTNSQKRLRIGNINDLKKQLWDYFLDGNHFNWT